MKVEIVEFPETKTAMIEHRGSPNLEHESVQKLIAWRIENKILPSKEHRNYGIHYNDPRKVHPSDHKVDFCLSIDHDVQENKFGVIGKVIPALRCAKVRHLGSREDVTAAHYLFERWLPESGETIAKHPVIFHYVNVGPEIKDEDMITDVYLPIL